jgi:hypothetical protein
MSRSSIYRPKLSSEAKYPLSSEDDESGGVGGGGRVAGGGGGSMLIKPGIMVMITVSSLPFSYRILVTYMLKCFSKLHVV